MGTILSSLGDNQEVEGQSGLSRMLNSIFMAICVAPFVLIICCLVLGYNERRAVCDQRAIVQGENEVVNVGCTSSTAGAGELVLFSCDLQNTDLDKLTVNGDFQDRIPANNGRVVGLRIESEMLQCVEHVESKTTKNNVGGGTTTVKTYTYSVAWRSSSVDSSSFKTDTASWQSNCNSPNPGWPSALPTAGTQWVSSANVGAFTVPQSYLTGVPLTATLTASQVPSGWTFSNDVYQKSGSGNNGIGTMRVSFKGNDWNNPRMTVLGLNTGGTIGKWMADDSWMCSGFRVGALKSGIVSKEDFFASLKAEASALTWILRVVFLLIMWSAFCCFFKPLEVAADCIPFVGPCLGNSISAITACISCPMAYACGMGVIGFMWVFMRPMVGGPLIIIFCLTMGGAIGLKVYTDKQKKAGGGSPDPEAVGAAES